MKTIGFIGGGRITLILLQGFKNANVRFEKITVYEPDENVLKGLKTKFPFIEGSTSDATKAAASDLVFLALHPPVLIESIQSLKNTFQSGSLIVSLAPKITIEKIKSVIPQVTNIARMNPNAGTFVNKGFNPVCFADSTSKNIIDEFISLFEKTGKVPVVPENKIEAYAVISAMGHTYFWFQLQELKELAITFGLSEIEAKDSISTMLCGTSDTLFYSELPYAEVTNLVPVKPMAEHENSIRDFYKTKLIGIYQKIKP